MKMMTCRELGGACDLEFQAETFEELAELSKDHGMDMMSKNDEAHIAAMQDMIELVQDRKKFLKWMKERQKEFDKRPDF